MKTIRGGRGLGDALYVQGVVRHLVGLGQRLAVRSDWPEVFRPERVIFEAFWACFDGMDDRLFISNIGSIGSLMR